MGGSVWRRSTGGRDTTPPGCEDGARLMHWLLFYDYVEDILERRAPVRERHLALAREAQERGVLRMAGAVGDPVDGALFVFSTDDRSIVDAFVEADPYVEAGLVTAWRAEPWNVVVGGD